MSALQWALLLVPLLVFFWAVGAYNRLARLRNAVVQAFAQIDAQFKRRHEQIGQLIEWGHKHLPGDVPSLAAAVAARNQARSAEQLAAAGPLAPGAVDTLSSAELLLAGAVGQLLALVQDRPDTQDDDGPRELIETLSATESRMGFDRQAYNEQAQAYNHAAQQFPALLIARLFNFKPQGLLESSPSTAAA